MIITSCHYSYYKITADVIAGIDQKVGEGGRGGGGGAPRLAPKFTCSFDANNSWLLLCNKILYNMSACMWHKIIILYI